MDATAPPAGPGIDADVFARTWMSLEPACRAILSVRLRDAHALDDVLQETALAAWTHRDQYDGRASLAGWIFGIAVRKAASHLRGRLREASLVRPILADMAARPEDALAAEPDEHPGWVILADLADPDRRLVEMRYLDRRPVGEMAAILAVAPGTVCSRLCRIRQRLRDRHQRRRRLAV
jgi:RNA polymerase sigma-70 factor (ECF subfamily)